MPPTAALRAFEAAARLGSFAAAAQELHLTTSAISHQIKALEQHLRVPLFVRHRQRVQLSDAGRQLLPAVQQAMQLLQDALAQVLAARSHARITVLPSINHRFLLGRLKSFTEMHPGIDLHIVSSQTLADLRAEGCDLGLRFGQGPWPGLFSERLAPEWMIPVAAPQLLQRCQAQGREALKRLPLLRDDYHPWTGYLRRQGLPADKVHFAAKFGDSAQLLEGAEAGLGIALARWGLARDAIERGALSTLRLPALAMSEAYHLVSLLPVDQLPPGPQALAQWLRKAMSQWPSPPGESHHNMA